MSNNAHPYWGKANQQRNQQQGRQQRPQTARQQMRDGFDDEWLGKDVEVEQVKGANVVVIRGRVVDVSKYWLKIIVNGEVVDLNKAYIVSIKPAEMKDTASGGGNGGEQRPKSK